MTSLAFSLIVFSSFMHAMWNLLVKRSRHKTVFIWWMFVCSAAIFTVLLPVLPGSFPAPGSHILLLSAGGAFCFFLYHLFNGRAYRGGDLSLTYPLSQTSMLYVPLWGIMLLGERVTIVGGCGIVLVITGVFCIQLQRLSVDDLLRPFRNLRNPSVRWALAAGFIYSFGAIIDKSGVEIYSPLYFTYLLVMFMLALMTLNLMRPRYRTQIIAELRENRVLILASGPVMMASFLSFRYGLSLAPMTYAVLVRQVSILIGVFVGVLFLREPCGKIRMSAALLILVGIILIRLG